MNKALLSVHRAVQAGNCGVFASSGSYVEDETVGETMELVERRGMYMLTRVSGGSTKLDKTQWK